MTLGEKIRAVREAEGYGRFEFSQMLNVPKETLISVEMGKVKKPNFEIVSSVCCLYPQYTYFLVGLPIDQKIIQIAPSSDSES